MVPEFREEEGAAEGSTEVATSMWKIL